MLKNRKFKKKISTLALIEEESPQLRKKSPL